MTLEQRIIKALNLIRPYIQSDGGDMTFVSVDDEGIVTLQLHGACVGCYMLDYTLKGAVEALLMERIPEVNGVISIEPQR